MNFGLRWARLLDSLHIAANTGLDFVQTRIQLFAVELEQEVLRACSLIMRGVTTLLLCFLAAGFIGVALIVVFWDSHRELVAILVAMFFALLAAFAGVSFRRALALRKRPFDSTLEVLERDSDALRDGR